MIQPVHMDYSDVYETPISVVATWQFQWDILHRNLPIVAQKKGKNKNRADNNEKVINRW